MCTSVKRVMTPRLCVDHSMCATHVCARMPCNVCKFLENMPLTLSLTDPNNRISSCALIQLVNESFQSYLTLMSGWKGSAILSRSDAESSMWFLDQTDGLPSIEQVFVTDQTLLPDTSIVTVPIGSARGERAAARIQRAWRRAITDPAFCVCRSRLRREFEGLMA